VVLPDSGSARPGPLTGFHRISAGKPNTAREESSFVFGVIP
jgi:hypothetical protein